VGRLVPASTGMEYYRQVKIAGEDVIEEPVVEPTLESIPGYDEDARSTPSGDERSRLNSSVFPPRRLNMAFRSIACILLGSSS
jgi:hypothetical protein